MKAMHWMMYTLLGITLLLTACVDDDKDLSQPKEPEKTTDLIIPDDADWTTTRSVNLSIHSPVATRVAIYTDAACTDESLLAETPVSDTSKSIELDVAKANRALLCTVSCRQRERSDKRSDQQSFYTCGTVD